MKINPYLKHAQYIAAETMAAIIGAGASLGSAGLNMIGAGSTNHKSFKRNQWLMEHQTELNKQIFDYQMNRNEATYEKYQSPSAIARQYAEAGMNPNLAYSQTGGSVGNVSVPQAGATGITNTQPVTDVGLGGVAESGANIANSVADQKLKLQQAQTEQKKQVYYENTASLQKAIEGNTVADTTYKQTLDFIANDMHGLNVQEKINALTLQMGRISELSLQVENLRFQVDKMNPVLYERASMDLQYTTALTMVKLATIDADVQMSFGQAQLIGEYVKNQSYERNLKNAQSYAAYKAGDVSHWEAGIRQQMHDNNFGVHRANSEYWNGELTKRQYKWLPVMNVTKMVTDVGGLVMDAVGMFTPAGIAGKLTKGLKGAQTDMYRSLANPSNLKTNSSWRVGPDDELYNLNF